MKSPSWSFRFCRCTIKKYAKMWYNYITRHVFDHFWNYIKHEMKCVIRYQHTAQFDQTKKKQKIKNKIRLAPYSPFLVACFECPACFVFHLIKRSKQDEGRTWKSRFSKSSKLNKSLGSYSELHMLAMAVIWNECKFGHVLYRIRQALGLYRRRIQLRLL